MNLISIQFDPPFGFGLKIGGSWLEYLVPLLELLEIVEWAAWQWANMKMDKENLFIMKQNVNISMDDMEDYNLVMFTHAMDFFKERTSLKKPV
jgi:hypothetical protein